MQYSRRYNPQLERCSSLLSLERVQTILQIKEDSLTCSGLQLIREIAVQRKVVLLVRLVGGRPAAVLFFNSRFLHAKGEQP